MNPRFLRLFLIGVALGVPALACKIIPPSGSGTLTCSSVDVTSPITLQGTIDNTGTSQEKVNVTVTDGAGNILLQGAVYLSTTSTTIASGTSAYQMAPKYNPLTLTVTTPPGNGQAGQFDGTVHGICPGLPFLGAKPNFTDGRCNQEPWQSFAVYPDNKGGYIFYSLHNSIGYYAMHVTEKDLDNNPDDGINHIIAQSDGVQLWRLAGGLLQVHRIGMDGKDYSF